MPLRPRERCVFRRKVSSKGWIYTSMARRPTPSMRWLPRMVVPANQCQLQPSFLGQSQLQSLRTSSCQYVPSSSMTYRTRNHDCACGFCSCELHDALSEFVSHWLDAQKDALKSGQE